MLLIMIDVGVDIEKCSLALTLLTNYPKFFSNNVDDDLFQYVHLCVCSNYVVCSIRNISIL